MHVQVRLTNSLDRLNLSFFVFAHHPSELGLCANTQSFFLTPKIYFEVFQLRISFLQASGRAPSTKIKFEKGALVFVHYQLQANGSFIFICYCFHQFVKFTTTSLFTHCHSLFFCLQDFYILHEVVILQFQCLRVQLFAFSLSVIHLKLFFPGLYFQPFDLKKRTEVQPFRFEFQPENYSSQYNHFSKLHIYGANQLLLTLVLHAPSQFILFESLFNPKQFRSTLIPLLANFLVRKCVVSDI